ncbi:MAG: response regulator transcription factor [Anaerolineales bacterium]|nr:response regulator transcription factor [Anaerolineales bacterium]
MSNHILLVDDDELMRRSLSFSLQQAGYETSTAATAEEALAQAKQTAPDIVLLDIGLPGMDGLQAVRYFQDDIGVPVIFLTARRRELDEIMGLELGAEDYITKPFDLDVLLARVRVVLRRAQKYTAVQANQNHRAEQTPITVGNLILDPAAHTLTVAGQPVELAAREFAVLHALALEAGRVVSIDDLLARVWGAEYEGESQVVYVHIRWLRQKIETDPNNPARLLTVRGVGYKLVPIG